MQKRCIFRYILSDAWMQPISQIEVFEDEESGSVRGHLGWEPIFFDEEGIKKDSSFEIALNQSDIEQIITLMIQYLVKFSDIELEITGVFDGVINFFEFSPKDTVSNKITAFNLWAFREYSGVDILGEPPYKGKRLLRLYDDIAAILLKNNVSENYLRIG